MDEACWKLNLLHGFPFPVLPPVRLLCCYRIFSPKTGCYIRNCLLEDECFRVIGKTRVHCNRANVVSWCCGRKQPTNDVIQKIEKTINNTNTTTQKRTNNGLRNTKTDTNGASLGSITGRCSDTEPALHSLMDAVTSTNKADPRQRPKSSLWLALGFVGQQRVTKSPTARKCINDSALPALIAAGPRIVEIICKSR